MKYFVSFFAMQPLLVYEMVLVKKDNASMFSLIYV